MVDTHWIITADATGNKNHTCRKTHNNSNPVETGLNVSVWSEAEKWWDGYETDEQADNETGCQTLGDFGLALRPASDWLISFCLSADRDKPNGVCIDHLTMIIRPDANGQVVTNDKNLDMELGFFCDVSFLVHSPFSSLYIISDSCCPDYFLSPVVNTSAFFPMLYTIDSPNSTNLISDWHRWAKCSVPAIQREREKRQAERKDW